jgi:hypothetical protein
MDVVTVYIYDYVYVVTVRNLGMKEAPQKNPLQTIFCGPY